MTVVIFGYTSLGYNVEHNKQSAILIVLCGLRLLVGHLRSDAAPMFGTVFVAQYSA